MSKAKVKLWRPSEKKQIIQKQVVRHVSLALPTPIHLLVATDVTFSLVT